MTARHYALAALAAVLFIGIVAALFHAVMPLPDVHIVAPMRGVDC